MSTKKAEARERVKAMREEQARKDRARERTMRIGIAIAVLVGVAIIAVAVISNRGGDGGDGDPPVAVAGEHDGIQVGDPDAPVTIESWIDFLCPHCKEFEDANAGQIDEWVEAGQVNVIYNPVTFTGGVNSTRANNAFACAAGEGKQAEFVTAAFAAPQQWTNNSLVELGKAAGIGGDYESCVRGETYNGWSADLTEAAGGVDEVQGTPTVFVNGELVEDWSPPSLAAAVQAAGADVGDVPAEEPSDEAAENGEENGAEQDEEGADAEDPGAEDD